MINGTKWHSLRLGDLGNVVTGRTPPSSQPELFGDLYPFITPSDMELGRRQVMPERFISAEGAEHFKRIALPPGTPSFVCIGATIGVSAQPGAKTDFPRRVLRMAA